MLWYSRNDGVKGPCMVVVWLGTGDMSEKPKTPMSKSGREWALVGSSKDLGISRMLSVADTQESLWTPSAQCFKLLFHRVGECDVMR